MDQPTNVAGHQPEITTALRSKFKTIGGAKSLTRSGGGLLAELRPTTGAEKVLFGSEQTVNAIDFTRKRQTAAASQQQKHKFIHALKGVLS